MIMRYIKNNINSICLLYKKRKKTVPANSFNDSNTPTKL